MAISKCDKALDHKLLSLQRPIDDNDIRVFKIIGIF